MSSTYLAVSYGLAAFLEVSAMGIGGSIPTEIGMLTELRKLVLRTQTNGAHARLVMYLAHSQQRRVLLRYSPT